MEASKGSRPVDQQVMQFWAYSNQARCMVRLEFQLLIDLFCLVIGMRMTFVSSAKQNSFLGGELGAVVGDYVERDPMQVEDVICEELNGFHCCGQWRKGNEMSGLEKALTVVSITILSIGSIDDELLPLKWSPYQTHFETFKESLHKGDCGYPATLIQLTGEHFESGVSLVVPVGSPGE